MTYVLVMILYFAGEGQYMRVEVHGFASRKSCEQVATWYAPGTAAETGSGGTKYWCETEQ